MSIVLVVAIAGKVFGCYFGAKWAGLSTRESWAIGFGMSARGAMEIILGQLALAHHLITEKLFVAIVVMAIATSLIAGPSMQLALRRKTKRKLTDFLNEIAASSRSWRAHTRRDTIREMSTLAAAGGRGSTAAIGAMTRCGGVSRLVSTGLPHGHRGAARADQAGLERAGGGDRPVQRGGRLRRAPTAGWRKIICLLLTPAEDGEAQLELLAAVAEAFQRPRRPAATPSTPTSFLEFKAALVTSAAKAHG